MYYAFQYLKDEGTTTGEPNKLTGKYSIAGDLVAFKSVFRREVYLLFCRMHNVKCKSVTPDEARRLCAGMSGKEYARYLNHIGETK